MARDGTPSAPEALGLQRPDWEELEGAERAKETETLPEPDGELSGENDDNPFQESDEALPDDSEERSIAKDPGREGGRFGES